MPLQLRDQIIGVINLINLNRQKKFGQRESHLMEILASQCAQFITNAKLHEEVFNQMIRLRQEVKNHYELYGIIGHSPKMQEVFTLLNRIISTESRVLLEGESGTGKELVARVLHYNGPRKNGPFVAVDCGALPNNLLESELFGYVKGAFTGAQKDKKGLFEEAQGGTLFLDEIVNMPLEVQSKLLRAIETGEIRPVGATRVRKVDMRIIVAASDDIRNRVKAGKFREDLFYRLNVVTIHLPPLRERKEDIPLLANHFLEKIGPKYGKTLSGFKPETIAYLENYSWPGNVCELENVIERMVILAPHDAEHLTLDLLPANLQPQYLNTFMTNLADTFKQDIKSMKATFEKYILLEALNKYDGNQSAAARELGVSERTVRYKTQKYGLKRGEQG